MSQCIRIAFAACPAGLPIVERVASRFAAIAEVRPYITSIDGSDIDALVPALVEGAPDAVITNPRPAALIGDRVPAPIVPFELPADVLVARVEEALRKADSVALLPPAGTLTPAVTRLLKRLGGAIHVLPYDNHSHLRDLVVRCRRMGVQTLLGGESTRAFAEAEELTGVSVLDRPDEANGALAQLIVRAATQAAPRLAGRIEELVAFGMILEKIAQGAIGPHDTTLCVDRRGRVIAAFTPPAGNGAGRALALPAGISVTEALAASTARAATAAGENAGPVALDLYPLTNGAGEGYLVVFRGSPRPAAVLAGALEGAGSDVGPDRLGRLLERVDALLERTETLARARRRDAAPGRFLASHRRRTFLVDWSRVRYFELRSGLVYAGLDGGEAYATNYTLADILARVDQRDFVRIHRHVIVNLNYVVEIERYGQGLLRLVLDGPDGQAFVTSRPASAALRKLLRY